MDSITLDDVVNFLKGGRKTYNRSIYSVWKHFPGRDLRPEDSVKAHSEFQNLVQSDLIKISPHSKFALVDFGAEFNPSDFNKETGSYITKKHPIVRVNDWEKIDEFDPQTGEMGKQIEIVRGLSKKITNVPTMMTVFLPTMIARKLVKDDNLIAHYNDQKDLVKDRLQVITNITVEYAKICIESGSTGLFVASQETSHHEGWNTNVWNQIAYPFDKQIIDKLRSKAEFQVLHLHGDDIFFKDVLQKLKPDAINFHSFPNFPEFFSTPEMRKVFSGTLLGGLQDKHFQNVSDDSDSSNNDLENLLTSCKPISDRILIAPNCVLSQSLKEEEIVNTIRKLRY